MGLGLALARRLAEAMGGTLEAKSERAQGSRFLVTLRAA
jgi:signal transduction histidine kinase